MWQERKPDAVGEVKVDGHTVKTYSFGEGNNVLFLLNGGPGIPCDYLREAHSAMTDHGFRVVTYDQLGTGASDRPNDTSLWNITRYVAEVETVRTAMGLGKVHLLGHSWGGWLSIEYGITHPDNLKTVMLGDTCADMPHLIQELDRHRAALGPETVAMMQRHEAEGTLGHAEYQAAITLLNYRHVCRLQTWPPPLRRSVDGWNLQPYETMQGPNEFLYTGNLKDWNRLPDMHRITCPALITAGNYDELSPACALRMRNALPNAELRVFENSSHTPFYEEPAAHYPALIDFLARHGGG